MTEHKDQQNQIKIENDRDLLGGWGDQIRNARLRFFDILARESDVLSRAKDDLLPLSKRALQELAPQIQFPATFERVRAENIRFGSPYWRYLEQVGAMVLSRWHALETADLDGKPATRELRDAIVGWGAAYNLRDSWIFDELLFTLTAWLVFPESESNTFESCRIAAEQAAAAARELQEEHPIQTAQQYINSIKQQFLPYEIFHFEERVSLVGDRQEQKKEIREKFKEYFDRFFGEIDQKAIDEGWKPLDTARKLEQHLEWLVLYQVRKMSPSQVEDEYLKRNPDEKRPDSVSTVQTAVTNAAERIALTLRPSNKGTGPKRKY